MRPQRMDAATAAFYWGQSPTLRDLRAYVRRPLRELNFWQERRRDAARFLLREGKG